MTKADLVEKVTQLGSLTRRDSGEVIVETIFDICDLQPCNPEIRSKFAASAPSASGSETPAALATDTRQVTGWTFQPSAYPTSNHPRSCATW